MEPRNVPQVPEKEASGVRLTKADYALLEKCFSAEINGEPPMQTKSKRIFRLAKDGLVFKETVTLKGWPPVEITGWYLTHAGRYAYCQWAAKQPEAGGAE